MRLPSRHGEPIRTRDRVAKRRTKPVRDSPSSGSRLGPNGRSPVLTVTSVTRDRPVPAVVEDRVAVRAAGGGPLLVYQPASKEARLRRLAARNRRRDANALIVTPQALDDFFAIGAAT